jgi:alkaline phosphatase D
MSSRTNALTSHKAPHPTYGPTVKFQAVPPHANTSPLEGSQFFGEIAIDGHSGELTTRLRDFSGKVLYTVALPAQR